MSALDDLQAMLPPPPGSRRHFDWTPVQQRLGITALPQDFKDLLTAYGDVRFCNVLRLYRPSTQPYLDLAEVTLASREPLASDEFGDPPTELPPGVSVDPAALIQWGGSFSGAYCLWDASDPNPDNWTLVFTDIDKIQWGFYSGTVTEFVLGWLRGHITPIPLWNLDNIVRARAVFCEFYNPTDFSDTALDRVEATTAQ